jgi:hypothetical protein
MVIKIGATRPCFHGRSPLDQFPLLCQHAAMIGDPISWIFLLFACALISGGLLVNGLRLRRLDVASTSEETDNKTKNDSPNGDLGTDVEIDDGLIRRGAALSIGAFGLMIMVSIAPSLNMAAAAPEFPAVGIGAIAVFFVVVVMCLGYLQFRVGE